MMVQDFWDAICYVFVVFTWNMKLECGMELCYGGFLKTTFNELNIFALFFSFFCLVLLME